MQQIPCQVGRIGFRRLIRTILKGTCWVVQRTAAQAHGQADAAGTDRGADVSLTGLAGLVAVDELTERLGLDVRIAPIMQRRRGLTGGQLLLGISATSKITR